MFFQMLCFTDADIYRNTAAYTFGNVFYTPEDNISMYGLFLQTST